ncbi:MAG: SDR family oxidoreductase [Myxococcales bacterium]|nr:SDR family oxidoreductase [Myxococcales bacterium]
MSGWAVVLGASAGTGAAVATHVARDPGLHVFGVHRGRYVEGAHAVEAEVRAAGREVVMRTADAGTAEGAEQGADALLAAAGKRSVRLVVHSIASASVGRLVHGERTVVPRQVEKTFDAMAHSFLYWTQALVARELLAPGAQILGLTNPLSESTLHNSGLIAAAKGALEMYVRHLAMELGPMGHRVNLLKFGTVVTPALRHVFDEGAMRRVEAVHARMIPAGRMVTLEEVAAFVAVLCKPAGAWFNGATIDFTGGMTQHLLDLVMYPEAGGGALS